MRRRGRRGRVVAWILIALGIGTLALPYGIRWYGFVGAMAAVPAAAWLIAEAPRGARVVPLAALGAIVLVPCCQLASAWPAPRAWFSEGRSPGLACLNVLQRASDLPVAPASGVVPLPGGGYPIFGVSRNDGAVCRRTPLDLAGMRRMLQSYAGPEVHLDRDAAWLAAGMLLRELHDAGCGRVAVLACRFPIEGVQPIADLEKRVPWVRARRWPRRAMDLVTTPALGALAIDLTPPPDDADVIAIEEVGDWSVVGDPQEDEGERPAVRYRHGDRVFDDLEALERGLGDPVPDTVAATPAVCVQEVVSVIDLLARRGRSPVRLARLPEFIGSGRLPAAPVRRDSGPRPGR